MTNRIRSELFLLWAWVPLACGGHETGSFTAADVGSVLEGGDTGIVSDVELVAEMLEQLGIPKPELESDQLAAVIARVDTKAPRPFGFRIMEMYLDRYRDHGAYADVLSTYTECLLRVDRPKDVVRVLSARSSEPSSFEERLRLGQAMALTHDRAAAIEYLTDLAGSEGIAEEKRCKALFYAAFEMVSLKRFDDAVEHFELLCDEYDGATSLEVISLVEGAKEQIVRALELKEGKI